jgi:hypothetical protein
MSPVGLGTKNPCAGEASSNLAVNQGPSCLRCNKRRACTERPTPPLVDQEAPTSTTRTRIGEKKKILFMDLEEIRSQA